MRDLGGVRRGVVSIPVTPKWREWLERYANSVPSLSGTEFKTDSAVLVVNLETLLGIEGGGGGDGVNEKVQLVNADGNPLASAGGSPQLPVAIANWGASEVIPVEIKNVADQTSEYALNVRTKATDQLDVNLVGVENAIATADQKLPVDVKNNPLQTRVQQVAPTAFSAFDANGVPVKVVSQPSSDAGTLYGIVRYNQIASGSINTMNSIACRLTIDQNLAVKDLTLDIQLRDPGGGIPNGLWPDNVRIAYPNQTVSWGNDTKGVDIFGNAVPAGSALKFSEFKYETGAYSIFAKSSALQPTPRVELISDGTAKSVGAVVRLGDIEASTSARYLAIGFDGFKGQTQTWTPYYGFLNATWRQ